MFQSGTSSLIPYGARNVIRTERLLPNHVHKRNIGSFFSKRKLKKLEGDANHAPGDPHRQVAFLRVSSTIVSMYVYLLNLCVGRN